MRKTKISWDFPENMEKKLCSINEENKRYITPKFRLKNFSRQMKKIMSIAHYAAEKTCLPDEENKCNFP